MKRALLIATGTVGGLGAVLAITPPQLGNTSAINIAGAPMSSAGTTSVASASSSSSKTAAAVATKGAKPVATKKAVAAKKPVKEKNVAVATTSPAASAATTAVNGTFTGPSVFARYGDVQVKITVVNGRITDAVAVKAPSGRNDRWTNMAVPILKEQTLKAQSANIQGVSGASYTTYGWYTSLQGALADAGL